MSNKASRRRAVANLFHAAMKIALQPLEAAGRDGITLISGDGVARHCHPIFAAFVGDYPEQMLVGLIKNGRCPVCPAPREGIGELDSVLPPRPIAPIIEALRQIHEGPSEFAAACEHAGIKPIQNPFWLDLPFVSIYSSITPDILHQIFQGVFTHIVGWVRSACGDAEIDARCRRLPPNHHIRLFMKGISNLSRVTGEEHDQMSRFLLGLILDIRLPDGISNARLIRVVRALLDFMNLARYPLHTSDTLDHLENALTRFHENKSIFEELGIRAHFDIPKLHNIAHYRHFIELYGTTDNSNTESTERLHIEMAKQAYAAGNKKDEYPQMTMWLLRREKILHHTKFVRRRLAAVTSPDAAAPLVPLLANPGLVPPRQQKMTMYPTLQAVSLKTIQEQYGAMHFNAALSRFIRRCQNPDLPADQIEILAHTLHIPFAKLPVYHRLKWVSRDISSLNPDDHAVVDSIHVEPSRIDKHGAVIPGRFDTAMINFNNVGQLGVEGVCYHPVIVLA